MVLRLGAPRTARERWPFRPATSAGSCYLGTSRAAALLEALQDFGAGLLPDVELRVRRMADLTVPPNAPPAAVLTSQRARGVGATAALWAGADRSLTQPWAAALYRAGWRTLFHGIQHDLVGRLRAVTLLDTAGEHPPYDDAAGWTLTVRDLWPSAPVERSLAHFGITVLSSMWSCRSWDWMRAGCCRERAGAFRVVVGAVAQPVRAADS